MPQTIGVVNGKARNKVTSKDVAELAGVTHTTVSRVLNKSGYVSLQTRQLVMEAIKKVGYKPFSAAREMACQRHETIGVVTEYEADENFYRSSFITGTSIAVSDKGYRMVMGIADTSASAGKILELPIFERRCMDGVILDLHRVQGDYLSIPQELELPCVFVNPPHPFYQNAVMPDDVSVAEQATDYLISHGHRVIGYMPHLSKNLHGSQFDRMKGYAQSMNKAGLSCIPRWDVPLCIEYGTPEEEEKAQRASIKERLRLYLEENRCTAVVAYNMRTASRIIVDALEMGLRIPDDFSLIACDYEPYVKFFFLPVTAIKLDRAEMAHIAVSMLINKIENNLESIPSVFVKGKFCEGQTVKSLM